jgi:hypothetical protein
VRKKGINGIITLAFVSVLATAAGAATEYDFQFHNYPNPFFPGGSVAGFAYVLPPSSSEYTVSIYVYDFDGALVRTVVENYPQVYGAHEGEVEWNGRDDNGDFADPGPYVIIFEANVAGETYRDTFVAVVNR